MRTVNPNLNLIPLANSEEDISLLLVRLLRGSILFNTQRRIKVDVEYSDIINEIWKESHGSSGSEGERTSRIFNRTYLEFLEGRSIDSLGGKASLGLKAFFYGRRSIPAKELKKSMKNLGITLTTDISEADIYILGDLLPNSFESFPEDIYLISEISVSTYYKEYIKEDLIEEVDEDSILLMLDSSTGPELESTLIPILENCRPSALSNRIKYFLTYKYVILVSNAVLNNNSYRSGSVKKSLSEIMKEHRIPLIRTLSMPHLSSMFDSKFYCSYWSVYNRSSSRKTLINFDTTSINYGTISLDDSYLTAISYKDSKDVLDQILESSPEDLPKRSFLRLVKREGTPPLSFNNLITWDLSLEFVDPTLHVDVSISKVLEYSNSPSHWEVTKVEFRAPSINSRIELDPEGSDSVTSNSKIYSILEAVVEDLRSKECQEILDGDYKYISSNPKLLNYFPNTIINSIKCYHLLSRRLLRSGGYYNNSVTSPAIKSLGYTDLSDRELEFNEGISDCKLNNQTMVKEVRSRHDLDKYLP